MVAQPPALDRGPFSPVPGSARPTPRKTHHARPRDLVRIAQQWQRDVRAVEDHEAINPKARAPDRL